MWISLPKKALCCKTSAHNFGVRFLHRNCLENKQIEQKKNGQIKKESEKTEKLF